MLSQLKFIPTTHSEGFSLCLTLASHSISLYFSYTPTGAYL